MVAQRLMEIHATLCLTCAYLANRGHVHATGLSTSRKRNQSALRLFTAGASHAQQRGTLPCARPMDWLMEPMPRPRPSNWVRPRLGSALKTRLPRLTCADAWRRSPDQARQARAPHARASAPQHGSSRARIRRHMRIFGQCNATRYLVTMFLAHTTT